MTVADYKVVLEDLARMQTMFLMLSGGEPMIHPDFFEIGAMTRDLGFVTRIRTNGHSLSPRMVKRVTNEVDPYIVEVSLHGAAAETHDRQTQVPGSFEKLKNNIAHGRDAGLRMSVVTTPTKWNEHEIEEMFRLCDDLDVPLRFQGPVAPRDNGDTTPLSIQPSAHAWNLIQEFQKSRSRGADSEIAESALMDSFDQKSKTTPATCSVGVAGVDIDPFGNVQACMHLQESAGNLHDQSIEEIWINSPLFSRARSRAIEAAKQFENTPKRQMGAHLYCLAVEENMQKGVKVPVPTR